MDNANFDKLLTDALYRAAELEYMEKPTNDVLDKKNQPSKQFKKKITIMLRNPQSYIRNLKRPVYLRVIRAAAVVLIAFTVLFGTTMAVSPTVRAAVVAFVRTWFEDRTIYQIPDRELNEGLTFGYIPEGFVLVEEIDLDLQLIYVFQDIDSTIIYITVSSGSLTIDNEDSFYYRTTINGFPAEVYESTDDEKPSVLVVHKENTGIFITLVSKINTSELIKIAENIE